jgi:site-specific recombinase XerD
MTLDELWQHFFYHLRIKRRAAATIRFYGVTQRALGRFALAECASFPVSLEELGTAHLRGFLVWLETQGLAAGGIHAHVRALKSFFGWATREELLARDPSQRLERPALPGRRLPTVTPVQASRLLQLARQTDQPLRDAALVLTLFDTGLRLAETTGLKLSDLQPERGVLRVIGKGNKERSVPIGTRALGTLTTYLRRERRPRHAGVSNLFLSRTGLALSHSGVGLRLASLAEQAGFERALVSPHAFRRGFAVEFLRNGGDVFTLQQIMGHSSLEMTRRYVSFLDEDLKAAHLRFSPADRL